MTVLITGGSGFVGINIIERLLDENLTVVNYALTPVPVEAMKSFKDRPGKYHYMKGDVLDTHSLSHIIQEYEIKKMIHAAAITPDVEREKREGKKIVTTNYMGTIAALEAARINGIEKVIYLSSSSVYGDTAFQGILLKEDHSIPTPRTLYEISKHAAERTALRYRELFNMEVIATRIGSVFGPWEHNTGIRDTLSAPFQATKYAVLNQVISLSRPGLRDWVYSRDVAHSITKLLLKSSLNYDVYNISSGKTWSISEWCTLLEKEFNHVTFHFVEEEANANINYFASKDTTPLSVERLKHDIGYEPQFGLEEAFRDYMNWLKHTSRFWAE